MKKTGKINNNERAETMTNKQKNFEFGYKAGIQGKPFRKELADYAGYLDGWDAGNCDRPSLEELIPIDVAKERSTGCFSY